MNNQKVLFCDAAQNWQLGVQDPATPAMEGMVFFHDYLLLIMIFIGIFIFWLLERTFFFFIDSDEIILKKNLTLFTHANLLEIIWTLIPSIVLLLIAIPSFALLYSLDEYAEPALTLKIIGHQWYWSYEYADYYQDIKGSLSFKCFNFDSYMIPTNDLIKGSFRLLEVDNRVLLPIDNHVRLLVTSADVLHSWAVPSFGIKVDACPGRLTETSLFIKREGVYYGQCSEICGVNHGFMPIVVKSILSDDYDKWFRKKVSDI